MGVNRLRVLLIEDQRGDARWVREMLAEATAQQLGPVCDLVWVERLEQMAPALNSAPYDIILLDLSLPDSQGLDTLRAALHAANGVPVVVMSGLGDRHIALQAVAAGAQDYLVKGHVDEYLLARVIQYAIERKRQEGAILAAQKLESIGILAGGVAHDFNNLLAGILLQTHLALEALPAEHPAGKHLEKVLKSAQRAADVTRQLLAYVGKGQFLRERLDLNRLVRESIQLLSAFIPAGVQVELALDAEPLYVQGDRSQLQQVVINLTTNAAEAMPGQAGRLLIRTERRVWPAEGAGNFVHGMTPAAGICACLVVSDTGCGMDAETQARIFDPFFTTKFTGRGMGLPAVWGIVNSQRGGVQVRSQPGQGSTFTVWLPAAAAAVEGA